MLRNIVTHVSELCGEVGKILFDDGSSCDFKIGDRSVFFLPTMQSQWKPNLDSDCAEIFVAEYSFHFLQASCK